MASSPASKGSSSSKYVAKSSPSGKKPTGKPKSKAAQNAASKAASRAFAPAVSVPSPTAGMTVPDKIVWICLSLLVFLVPIAMSNYSWIQQFVASKAQLLPLTYDQFDIVKVFVMRAAALGGLAAWAYQFFFKGGKLRRTKLDWLILGFLAWVLLTSFTSISPATALFGKYRRFEGFFSFVTYAIVYFLVVQVVDRPSRIRAITRTFLFSSIIVAGYGVLQSLGADPLTWGALPFEVNRAFSTFGNPDLLGGFLVFPLAISIAMALSESSMGWRIFYWATFLITVWAWIAAFVRGAWIGGAVALIIFVAAAFIARLKLREVDWTFLGLTGLAGGALVVKSLSNPNAVMNVWERLASIFKMEGSALTRFEIWQAAIDAVKARPVFGFGADTFRLVFPLYKPQAYVRDAGYLSVADNVHNYPLQLMAGIGIIGFVLLYGLFGWALWLGAPNAFARGKGTERLVLAGFWAAAVGYIVHLMTGLSVTGSTVFLWMSLAIIVSPTATETEHKAPAWGAIVGTLLVATLCVAWIGNFVLIAADNVFLRGQFAAAGEDPIALNKQAIALNPFNDTYRSMLGKSYESLFEYWSKQIDIDRSAGKPDNPEYIEQLRIAFEDTERTYQETIAIVPTEYDNYLFLSALYNKAASYLGDSYLDKAIVAADAGIAAEPYGPGVRLQKAVAQAGKGDVDGGIATIMETAKWDPNYSDPKVFSAQLLMRAGRYAEAEAQLLELKDIAPSDTNYVNVHMFYGQLLSAQQRYEEAEVQLALLKGISASDINYVNVHLLHAEVLANLGRYPEAVDAYRLAIRTDRSGAASDSALKAKDKLLSVARTDPRYVDVHIFYVQLLASLERYKDAEKQVSGLLFVKTSDPNWVNVHSLYAELLRTLKRYAPAAAQYRLLLKTDPSNTATSSWTSALKAIEASMSAPAAGTTTP